MNIISYGGKNPFLTEMTAQLPINEFFPQFNNIKTLDFFTATNLKGSGKLNDQISKILVLVHQQNYIHLQITAQQENME